MSPDLYLRLLDHADALGVELRARETPLWRLPRFEGERHPNGSYDPVDRVVYLGYNRKLRDEQVEVVAMHELGHAATLVVDDARIREHSHEMASGRVSDQTKREECDAWCWAAAHMPDRLREEAARRAILALDSYHVDPAEIRRVVRALRAA
jgi:hypothetical protein